LIDKKELLSSAEFPPRNRWRKYNAALIELRHELGTKQQLGWNVDCERAVLSITRSI